MTIKALYSHQDSKHRKIADALAMPGIEDIAFDPPRVTIGTRLVCHCEEQSDAAIQEFQAPAAMDCRASLAMTTKES